MTSRTDVRYGLNQAYLIQDLVAWNPSIWDRYMLTKEEESFAKVSSFSSHCDRANDIARRRFLPDPFLGHLRHPRQRARLGSFSPSHH
jgi:hypothetical protein